MIKEIVSVLLGKLNGIRLKCHSLSTEQWTLNLSDVVTWLWNWLTTTWYMIGRRTHVIKPIGMVVASGHIASRKETNKTWTPPVSSYTLPYRTTRRNRNPTKRGIETIALRFSQRTLPALHSCQQASKRNARSNLAIVESSESSRKRQQPISNESNSVKVPTRAWAKRVFRWTSLAFPAFCSRSGEAAKDLFTPLSVPVSASKSKRELSGKVGCYSCQEVSGIMWLLLGFIFHVL